LLADLAEMEVDVPSAVEAEVLLGLAFWFSAVSESAWINPSHPFPSTPRWILACAVVVGDSFDFNVVRFI
jgi:hypothetical protein